MIRSMTAFARQEYQENWGQICWELRSVNHRYLDIFIRLPEDFRRLEVTIRERIQQQLKRGKIDCILFFQPNKNGLVPWQINLEAAQQVYQAIQQVNAITGNTDPPKSIDILRWQGVVEMATVDTAIIEEAILHHFNLALSQLIATREREGSQLATVLEQRCQAIEDEVRQIRQELPNILQAQRERLQTRLAELLVEVDPQRLEQEIVILAQKMDVAEELDRLETHLGEITHVLKQDQAIGRRLDFLIQELHREANTLGAKSNHISTSRHAIELKVFIEQMREQTQNLE
jgi:uncharacterized protein (TIGR00255 family)